MSKLQQWKKIFLPETKEKVQVLVGSKEEQLTTTQSYRFDQLQKSREADHERPANPFEESRYSLAEAAFRLMISEQDVLTKASTGELRLYADASGRQGCWQHLVAGRVAEQSSLQTLARGYLALAFPDCKKLEKLGHADLTVLELPSSQKLAAAGLDKRRIEELRPWGEGKVVYRLREPMRIETGDVVLLPPLGGD